MLDHATAIRPHPHTKVAIIGAGFGGIAMAAGPLVGGVLIELVEPRPAGAPL